MTATNRTSTPRSLAPRRALVSAFAALLLLAPAAAADLSITLRPAIRLAETRPILLSDIAALSGSDAPAAADVVILAEPMKSARAGSTWVEISADQVQAALKNVAGIPGAVSISGSTCAVHFVGAAAPTDAAPIPAYRPAPAASDQPASPTAGTVAELVTFRLAAHFGVAPADLRLKFREGKDASSLLAEPAAGRRVDIATGTSATSARQSVRVTIYEGDRPIRSGSITADAQIRREVSVASGPIDRGTPIDDADVSTVTRWLPPQTRPPAQPSDIVGSVARSGLQAGDMVLATHVQPAIAAKRGDVVYVDYLGPSFTLQIRARALAAAAVDDEVDLKIDGSDKPFKARMTSKGHAVMMAP